jgi:hypothetical protein
MLISGWLIGIGLTTLDSNRNPRDSSRIAQGSSVHDPVLISQGNIDGLGPRWLARHPLAAGGPIGMLEAAPIDG